MTEKSPEFLIENATFFKSDELLRYLHILDTLAYESLAAQLKYFEKEIKSQSHSTIKHLKWIATKKYMCFFEVKKSLLKSSDFIDINKFVISNKNDLYYIIRRPNITHFFNLLFANFDPTAIPDLQNIDIKSFFSYVVPPSLMQSEEIWDLNLNLRVQIYISKINKNPQRNLYKTMFPNVEDGPPMYKETYIKFCNIIQRYSEDVEMLMKEFKWSKFVQDMFKCLSNIFNRVNESEMPLLYKYPSIEALPISSSSSNSLARVVIIEDIPREDISQEDIPREDIPREDIPREDIENSAKKRRLADTEGNDDDISSDNIGDNLGDNLGDSSSILKKEEIEQITSQNDSQLVELIVDTELKRTQSDLLPNSDGESLSSTLNPRTPRTPRSERRSERDNKANSNGKSATLPMQKTMERSSSSLTNMNVDQPESVDDRQSSSDESFTEGSPPYEQNEGSSRKKLGKRKAIDIAGYDDYDETRRMTKRTKVKWTDQELLALEEGMRQHGKQWTIIKRNYGKKGQALENRSAAKLKDKARCEHNRRQRDGIEVGVFGIMDGQ